MKIDSIWAIKKPAYKKGCYIDIDPEFWDIKITKNKKNIDSFKIIKKNNKKRNYKQIISLVRLQDIKKNVFSIFNKKVVFSLFASFIIIIFSSVSVFSYKFISENYDFFKLFSSGKYLILLQNNTEMRPSGGFIGSFAVIEMKDGSLVDFYFDTNIYKRDNIFSKNNSIQPIESALSQHLKEGKLAMRDSNWPVDFPEAAKQVAWFYENEGGTPVDGVVAINATVFSELLKVTGPIELPEYNLIVNSENFIREIQYKVEREYWSKPENLVINEPKSVLRDLIPVIFNKINEKKKYSEVINILKKELQKKQILMFFYDDNKEKIALENEWAGNIKQVDFDYLYIVNSNLGGNKSSLNVEEEIKLNSSIGSDGTVLNQLTVTRTHTGDGIWPDGENGNFMKILVPYGSEIISAKIDGVNIKESIEVQKESGKTVYTLWICTKPRSSRIFNISYKLPFKLDKNNHSVLVQKQPGNLGDKLEVIIDGKLKYNGILNRDLAI